MRLTFGDMIKEVNVFNLRRQPGDINDKSFEANSIENLTSEHEESIEMETESEFDLESEDFNLDQIVDSAVDCIKPKCTSFQDRNSRYHLQ